MQTTPKAEEPTKQAIEIQLTATPKIGFVSHQNSIPLLKELSIKNNTDNTLKNLTLKLTSNPLLLEEKSWKIEQLNPQSELHISQRQIRFDAEKLLNLTESLQAELQLELYTEEQDSAQLAAAVQQQTAAPEEASANADTPPPTSQIPVKKTIHASYRQPLEFLPTSQWGGSGCMIELLPAFCTPNDPVCDTLLKNVCNTLSKADKDPSLKGYERQSRSRTWEVCSALWTSIAELKIDYTLPPANFEEIGQKIRNISSIYETRLATCLDSTLLFASALEQMQLHPLIILMKEHAFVGVWLQPQKFNQLIVEDPMVLRKRIELNELIVFETTAITQHPAPPFSEAIRLANRQLNDDEAFHLAIDIKRARMLKIRPLSLTTERKIEKPAEGETENEEEKNTSISTMEAAPNLPAFDVEIQVPIDEKRDRITQWQRKLLDLTTRNRLLHLPEKSKHLPFFCNEISEFEDLLAAGKTFNILALPDFEQGGRDSELFEQTAQENLAESFIEEGLKQNQLYAPLSERRVEAMLIDLYRKTKSDLAEGGSNTLFLALGFLHWKKSEEDSQIYKAPLLLMPVTLNRKSARSPITLSAGKEETRFNMTLLELFKQDFDFSIPSLENGLPEDEAGVDIKQIWNIVRHHIKDINTFEVKEECALANLSFAKYLMWKDLVDRKEDLLVNPIVKQLLEPKESGFDNEKDFPETENLDRETNPAEIFAPLPADSSQLTAIVASSKGCNFVLDGPPGTGKSQTIANMIVHNLALGKRVLFVAEKMAALEVVHRRLQEKGLGQFCLEVHSNKTSKTSILQQLDQAWNTIGNLSKEEWNEQTTKLKNLRDTLNKLCAILHEPQENGMTLHYAMGKTIHKHKPNTVKLNWGDQKHTPEDLKAMREVIRKMSLHADAISLSPESFSLISNAHWTNAWQDELLETANKIPKKLTTLKEQLQEFSEQSGIQFNINNSQDLHNLHKLSKTLLACYEMDVSCIFEPTWNKIKKEAAVFQTTLEELNQLHSSLSTDYPKKNLQQIDLVNFETRYKEATKKFFLFRNSAIREVLEEFQKISGSQQTPDLPEDLPKLEKIQNLIERIEEQNNHLTSFTEYKGSNTNLTTFNQHLEIAESLHQNITACANNPEQLQQLKTQIKQLAVETNELLSPDSKLHQLHLQLTKNAAELEKELNTFYQLTQNNQLNTEETSKENSENSAKNLAKKTNHSQQQEPWQTIESFCEQINSKAPELRRWCAWQSRLEEAYQWKLDPIVKAIEQKNLKPEDLEEEFITAYCRWFAVKGIDNTPELRQFSSREQNDTIANFREIDDNIAKLSLEYTKAVLTQQLPAKDEVGKKDGYSILQRELQKKRMHKPLRQLATEMGDAFTSLAPCMLMSPLSIAQYLPANQQLFDLVIFDEASQITPWDAVGSIARGNQVIVAGDPRQMPPTNFFQRAGQPSDFDDATESDLESILDECLAVGVPRHSLNWHYRSRHESLIAFSNSRYYDGKLITFPAALTKETAVTWTHVNQGIYAKGKARHNQEEAKAVVAAVVERLQKNQQLETETKTLGIITFNTEQQRLIEDLLDAARRDYPEIEPYFSDDLTEPVIVKNLETVQGDERDIIFISVGYGPTEIGVNTMSMNFGPLNREGGERRLNVALTRSRQEMQIFSSFEPSLIDLNRTNARAVRDLKHFLEFAEKGPKALGAAIQGSVGGYDSPFEEGVAERLRELGWEVVPQIGVSRFRIDLGIVHPDKPGDYLAGVECDGATYHSSATARDRDKVRAAVLEGLGWNLFRIWSTDWFLDPEGEVQRLHERLQQHHQEMQQKA